MTPEYQSGSTSPQGNAKTTFLRPGALQHKNTTILYHTHQVGLLVQGRAPSNGKHPIRGLLNFAATLSPIHEAAKSDDPYADYFLLLVENKLEQIRADLKSQRQQLVDRAEKISADITLAPANSDKPQALSARFKSPYAFGAAYLMQDLDNYIAHCLHLNSHCVIPTPERHKRIHNAIHLFRSLFTSVIHFKAFGITRSDLKRVTATAQQAIEYYQSCKPIIELDTEIIGRKKRAEYAPVINLTLINKTTMNDDFEADDI